MDLSKFSSVVELEPDEALRIIEARSKSSTGPSMTASVHEGRLSLVKEQSSGVVNRANEGDAPPVPSGEDLQSLVEENGMTWNSEYEGRAVPYIGSDESVDSYGDIVRQNWDFSLFERNPVMPFSHEWWGLPIGVHLDWKVLDAHPARDDYEGPALWLLGLFATANENEFADSVFRLVSNRFLRSSSVGFYSKTIIDVKDEDERAELGLGRWGLILDNNVLLEHSPTMLGANTGAFQLLNQMKSRGQLQPNDITVIRELSRRACVRRHDNDGWKEQDRSFASMGRILFPSQRNLYSTQPRDIEEPLFQANEQVAIPRSTATVLRDDNSLDLHNSLRDLHLLLSDGLLSLSHSVSELQETVESIKARVQRIDSNRTPAALPRSDANGTAFSVERLRSTLSAVEQRVKS